MVNVELIHNPYLRETQVRFNGREPRVNSAIEKYAGRKLADWVDEAPSILRDEMNGYGFELIFSGTDTDFEALSTAFSAAGVGEGQVRLVRKAALGDVREKQTGIHKLYIWLDTHRNRKFDYAEFLSKNQELIDNSFPLIVLHGTEDVAPDDTSIEEINSIEDLDNTDLDCTPIIYHLSRASALIARKDVAWLLSRKDVMPKQLFFVVHSDIQEKNALRTLSDLGVENPRSVGGADDEIVARYVENYPLTEYVHHAIEAFDGCIERMEPEFKKANEAGAQSSADERARIAKIDDEISRLKEAQEHFAHLDFLEEPDEFWSANAKLEDSLLGWKSRKTKVTGEQEVMNWADDFEMFARRSYAACLDEIHKAFAEAKLRMEETQAALYKRAGVDQRYEPIADKGSVVASSMPDLRQAMFGLVSISYEEPRSDLFGLFSAAEPDENGLVKVTSCYLDQWREAVARLLVLAAQETESKAMGSLRSRYEQLGQDYAEHLADLVAQKKEDKEGLISRLSEDERALQEDNDWLSEFKEQLQEIKRG